MDNGSCKLSLMMKFVVVRTVIVSVEWNKPENDLRFKIHNYSVGGVKGYSNDFGGWLFRCWFHLDTRWFFVGPKKFSVDCERVEMRSQLRTGGTGLNHIAPNYHPFSIHLAHEKSDLSRGLNWQHLSAVRKYSPNWICWWLLAIEFVDLLQGLRCILRVFVWAFVKLIWILFMSTTENTIRRFQTIT